MLSFVTSDKSSRETIVSAEIVPRTTEVPQFLKRMTAHKKSTPNLKKTITDKAIVVKAIVDNTRIDMSNIDETINQL